MLTGDKPGGSLALLPQIMCCTWGAVPLATGPLALSPGVRHMPLGNLSLRESFIVTITQPGGNPFTPLETHLP